MREFLTESVLPFFAVCGFIWGLTVAFFDVPRDPPPLPSAAASVAVPLPAPVAAREQMNDVLARAMRQLDAARTPRPAEHSASLPSGPSNGLEGARVRSGTRVGAGGPADPGLVEPSAAARAPTDPGLLQTMSALGEAVKAVHAVRTEEDIRRAEESIRSAREQMEEACKAGGSGGPLCEGASQMRSLGY